MTNDPNKYDPNKKDNQSGQQDEQQSGQQQNVNNSSQKRPTQGGTDVEQDQQKDDRTGQRKAS
jgi:hypothetical protein